MQFDHRPGEQPGVDPPEQLGVVEAVATGEPLDGHLEPGDRRDGGGHLAAGHGGGDRPLEPVAPKVIGPALDRATSTSAARSGSIRNEVEAGAASGRRAPTGAAPAPFPLALTSGSQEGVSHRCRVRPTAAWPTPRFVGDGRLGRCQGAAAEALGAVGDPPEPGRDLGRDAGPLRSVMSWQMPRRPATDTASEAARATSARA